MNKSLHFRTPWRIINSVLKWKTSQQEAVNRINTNQSFHNDRIISKSKSTFLPLNLEKIHSSSSCKTSGDEEDHLLSPVKPASIPLAPELLGNCNPNNFVFGLKTKGSVGVPTVLVTVSSQFHKQFLNVTSNKQFRSFHFHVKQRNWNEGMSETSYDNINNSNRNLVFVSQANPMTGKMDWVVQEENHDYVQEIARSGYGDMLHDVDRNKKYYEAIRKVVATMKAKGKQVKVLDIGTGTGLLSMMAATAGADEVTACEAFEPMAECARIVLKENGFHSKVKLVPKRSTEVSLGEDICERANLLVTELFDTELIGEGAIGSYTDAHSRLMQEDSFAIPSTGIVYVQVVDCHLLKKWNTLQDVTLPNDEQITMPDSFKRCAGVPSLHDLQIDELRDHLKLMTDPIEVFRFDFSRRDALPKQRSVHHLATVLQNGSADAFVMWWDLEMDPEAEIILSCAPCWTREKDEAVPWRDHWMQALYYPMVPQRLEKGGRLDVYSSHDEYSLWFDTIGPDNQRPVCACGLHVAFSRSRLGQMNSDVRNGIFLKSIQKHINTTTNCLVISEGSLLPLMVAKLGAKNVFYYDSNTLCSRLIKEVVEQNHLENKIHFIDKDAENLTKEDFLNEKVDLVLAEPHFQGAQLPWEHLFFWYAWSSITSNTGWEASVLPRKMTIKAMAIHFRDLHKIRAPVGNCEGFDITEFDKLIEVSSDSVDDLIEPQPLWEYPASSLSDSVELVTLDFSHAPHSHPILETKVKLSCSRPGSLNGIAFWTDVLMDDGLTVSCGPTQKDFQTDQIKWDMFTRQGVHLLRNSREFSLGHRIEISTRFVPENADFSFEIHYEKS